MDGRVVLRTSPAELQQQGPILKVLISHTQAELTEATSLGLQFPPSLPFNALIDTGAAVTVINRQLAETYKLKYTGPERITSVGSAAQYFPGYAAAISFPDRNLRRFDIVRIIACPLASPAMSCLIGRDILRYWELTYNGGSGEVTIRDLRP
jgi:predicted aspartyl protease